jgi:hypothetical protein
VPEGDEVSDVVSGTAAGEEAVVAGLREVNTVRGRANSSSTTVQGASKAETRGSEFHSFISDRYERRCGAAAAAEKAEEKGEERSETRGSPAPGVPVGAGATGKGESSADRLSSARDPSRWRFTECTGPNEEKVACTQRAVTCDARPRTTKRWSAGGGRPRKMTSRVQIASKLRDIGEPAHWPCHYYGVMTRI